MKYIGIGMIWLAVAIMVSAIVFATHDGETAGRMGIVGSVCAFGATYFMSQVKEEEEAEEE